MLRILPFVVLLSVLLACVHKPIWHSTSTIPLEPGSYHIMGPAKGQDCHWSLLGILPLSNSSETHVAIDDALGSRPGSDALINVTTDTFAHWYILLVRRCIEVDATAVRLLR